MWDWKMPAYNPETHAVLDDEEALLFEDG